MIAQRDCCPAPAATDALAHAHSFRRDRQTGKVLEDYAASDSDCYICGCPSKPDHACPICTALAVELGNGNAKALKALWTRYRAE
jgi:hypothetical protein